MPPDIEYRRPLLYPKQEQAIFYPWDVNGEMGRYSLIEASTKTGKTVGCIAWLFEQALLHGAPGRNYWWIAPVFGQAKIAFTRMKQFYPEGTFNVHNGNMTLIVRASGAMIWFKSGEKSDNLYGEDVYAAVLDEASRMREQSWWAVRSTLTATRGPVRFIGNVKGRRNWFYALARKAESGEQGMAHFKITAYDAVSAGVLDDEEIASAKRDLPENVFKELYLAEPSEDGSNPFGIQYIAQCVREMPNTLPVAWGWDLAKGGKQKEDGSHSGDWTVGIGLDNKGRVCAFERWQGKPWAHTMSIIRGKTKGLPALVDSTGAGDPVLEDLQSKGGRFEGYLFTSQSKQKLMEGLAVAVQSQQITFPDNVIRQEMEDFEYVYTRTGVKYSAPDGFHDDCVCALALARECAVNAPKPLIISDNVLNWAGRQ